MLNNFFYLSESVFSLGASVRRHLAHFFRPTGQSSEVM